MKPPSLAASAAACAVVSSHCLKAAVSSAVALELTMALTACSSSRICCPACVALVGLKPLSGFWLCWVIAWTSKAISASSCSRVGGLVADFKDAADSLASSIGPPGSAREIAIPATRGARRTRTHSSSVKSLFVVMTVALHAEDIGWGRPQLGSTRVCRPPAADRFPVVRVGRPTTRGGSYHIRWGERAGQDKPRRGHRIPINDELPSGGVRHPFGPVGCHARRGEGRRTRGPGGSATADA